MAIEAAREAICSQKGQLGAKPAFTAGTRNHDGSDLEPMLHIIYDHLNEDDLRTGLSTAISVDSSHIPPECVVQEFWRGMWLAPLGNEPIIMSVS